jgi:hypothetical protein
MKKPWRMAPSAVKPFLLAIVGAGCYPRAETDMGRLVLAHHEDVELLGWSGDNTTLYWTEWDAAGHYGLEAVDVQMGTEKPVLNGHNYVRSLNVSTGDHPLYFIGDSPNWYSAGVLYQVPLVDHRAGTAVPVATNISTYSVSLGGDRLALVDATTSEMSTIDSATGTRRSFGKASPGAFSPDGTRLLYITPSASGTSTVYLADPLTGASEPFDHPGVIIAWDGGTPKQVQPTPNLIVDVVTGQTRQLPGYIPMLTAYSGDPTDRTMGYYPWVKCLYETVAEDGVTECGESQGLIYRVDLRTGQQDVIAKFKGRSYNDFAVSEDGKRLAITYAPNDSSDLSLFVKELVPP